MADNISGAGVVRRHYRRRTQDKDRDKERTVKAPKKPETRPQREAPIDQLRSMFGREGSPLTYGQIAACLGPAYTDDQVRKWAQRRVPDEEIGHVIEVFGGTVEWYDGTGGTPPNPARRATLWAPGGPLLAPKRPPAPRSGGQGSGGRAVPATVGLTDIERQDLVGIAQRVATAVQLTIEQSETGYTAKSRYALAESLEVFATDIDQRCGRGTAQDIWIVIAWLRKSSGPTGGP